MFGYTVKKLIKKQTAIVPIKNAKKAYSVKKASYFKFSNAKVVYEQEN